MPERAEIDTSLCVGTGACELADPRHFRLLDEGVAEYSDDGTADGETLRHVADLCPAQAIAVRTD
jgi:ferredoxin